MRLDAFLLADAASAPPDGKFYIHGGGLSRFVVPMIPYPLGVALFIRLEVEEEELAAAHHFRVTVHGPVGLNIAPLEFVAHPWEDAPPLLAGEKRFVQVALNLPLAIVRTGLYRIELHADGELMESLPIPLILEGEGENGSGSSPP
jgi:hypothetical protein